MESRTATSALGRVLLWTGIAVGGLLVILLVVLALFDWNSLKHPIERAASAKSGRSVTLGGSLEVHIWSLTPTVTVHGLTLGNPPWEASRPMATIERLEIRLELLPLLKGEVVLPRVALLHPDIYLHQDSRGRANWTFENQAPSNARAAKPTRLPAVRDFIIDGGRMTLVDEMRRLRVNGTVVAHEQASQQDPKPFKIDGTGTINAEPFELHLAGGPLVNLDPEHPYPFDLHITAGQLRVLSDGRVLKPFNLSDMDFNVTVSGQDLADGFFLTQLALPNTPPFKLHAHIERHGMKIGVSGIAGQLGASDLGGMLDIDATRKRPSVTGELTSKRLRMADLAAPLGKHSAASSLTLNSRSPSAADSKQAPKVAAAPDPNALLFPDAHLQVNRVRSMNADVHFHAESIEAGPVPVKRVAFHVRLDEGVLSLAPFSLEMAQGKLSGDARIDANQSVPAVHIDARIKDIDLGQLKGKAPGAVAPLTGKVEARAVIDGKGDSLHRVMSDASGTFTLIMPNGEIRSAFAELTGIDVAKGIGLLLKGPDDRAEVRCGVAQFAIHDGDMRAQTVVFDTQNVLITGKGAIQLGPETLDLSIKGDPKKPRLTRLRSPVQIKGRLRKPSVGISVAETAKQGTIAVALGALLTPVAAVLAFVDPGLAKDQNCAELVASTRSAGPPPPQPAAGRQPQNTAPIRESKAPDQPNPR